MIKTAKTATSAKYCAKNHHIRPSFLIFLT